MNPLNSESLKSVIIAIAHSLPDTITVGGFNPSLVRTLSNREKLKLLASICTITYKGLTEPINARRN